MIVNSGAGDVAWGDGVQRVHVGGVHVGAVACFHWCRSHNRGMLVVDRHSAGLVVRAQGESDSMETGHGGFEVCD